jgi:hypothetical protein
MGLFYQPDGQLGVHAKIFEGAFDHQFSWVDARASSKTKNLGFHEVPPHGRGIKQSPV